MIRTRPAAGRPFRPTAARAALVALPLAALALLGSACSSSSSSSTTTTIKAAAKSPSTTATTAPSSKTATTSATVSAADTALAKSQLLPTSAYPSGWKGQGSGSTNTDASFFGGGSTADVADMATCLGIPAASVDPTPAEAADQEYDDPNGVTTVTDTVDVFHTTAQAVTDVTAAANPKAPGCVTSLIAPGMSQGIAQEIGEGATVGQVTVTAATVPPAGDHSAALIIAFPFSDQGVSGTAYIEDIAVQKGRSESNLEFSGTDLASEASTIDSLTTAAANQLTT